MSDRRFWTVEPIWEGATVAILGGGPSLTAEQAAIVGRWRFAPDKTRRARVIAINSSVYIGFWADLLYFCDLKWFGWHEPAVQAFPGIAVTLDNLPLGARRPGLRHLVNYCGEGLQEVRDGVNPGGNSGYQAINLAVHLGARRIVLLGYDMKAAADGRCHHHPEHADGARASSYERVFLKRFPALVEPLERRGVEVINATPGSALGLWPKLDLEAALVGMPTEALAKVG